MLCEIIMTNTGDEKVGDKQFTRFEKCLFERGEVELPEILLEDVNLYLEVINLHTWQSVLNESQRRHLMTYLPYFQGQDEVEKERTLWLLFNGVTFKFGNPVKQFFRKIRNGMFSPEISKYAKICYKAMEREYRYEQKVYYSCLLHEVLTNRQKILEILHRRPPDDVVKFNSGSWVPVVSRARSLERRASETCYRIISEINEECGIPDSASSDEDDLGVGRASHKQLGVKVLENSKHSHDLVLDTFAPKSMSQAFAIRSFNESDVVTSVKSKKSCCRSWPSIISGEQYLYMLRCHKRRKVEYQDHPELNFAGLLIEDIIDRVNYSRRGQLHGSHHRKLKKFVRKEIRSIKNAVSREYSTSIMCYDGSGTCDRGTDQNAMQLESSFKAVNCNVEQSSDGHAKTKRNNGFKRLFPHFFSLIKYIICDEFDGKITNNKLEEKVTEWQETESVSCLNSWRHEQRSWTTVLPSAVKFLCGYFHEDSSDEFVPLLDFKERMQQWIWIGYGRDSEERLTELHKQWSTHSRMETVNYCLDSSFDVPPPRMWTDYKIKPRSEEEKLVFQAQERERFSNPTRAFTYRVHGYEAVVGPVKGVYANDSTNRPRDHALLVKERPPYVTILTLVHDGSARLPNGEGTRSQICELLKDSQFLAPGVTDAQLNAVVSGALDRLHYEKDPCVKYDSLRKLWIYRHRNRAEADFERIHKAQEAFRTKRKVLQKPKVLRTCPQRTVNNLHHVSETVTLTVTGSSDVYKIYQSDGNSQGVPDNGDDRTPAATAYCQSTVQSLPVTDPLSSLSSSSPSTMSNISSAGKNNENTSVVSSTFPVHVRSNFLNISMIQSEQPALAGGLTKSGTLTSGDGGFMGIDGKSPKSVLMSSSSHKVTTALVPTESAPMLQASVQLVLPYNSRQIVASRAATSSTVANVMPPSSSTNQQKPTSVLTLPGTNLFRGLGVKSSLSAASNIITGVTFPRRASVLNSEQMIAVAVPDTSKSMLLVTRSVSVTSSQSSVTRVAGQLIAGQILRPSSGSRPFIISGQPKSASHAPSGRTIQFIGRPLHLVHGNRSPVAQVVQGVRIPTVTEAQTSDKFRGAASSCGTTPNILSQILQHRPATVSLLTHRSTVSDVQTKHEAQSCFRMSVPHSSEHTSLSSSLLQRKSSSSCDQTGTVNKALQNDAEKSDDYMKN